jgi:hypothetical protein
MAPASGVRRMAGAKENTVTAVRAVASAVSCQTQMVSEKRVMSDAVIEAD